VVGAEELSWLTADVLALHSPGTVLAAGAGAVVLARAPRAGEGGVRLDAITDAFTYGAARPRLDAARRMRDQLLPAPEAAWLWDGLQDDPRGDRAERAAWAQWSGPRRSPKLVLGEGLMAASAWQCVAACASIKQGTASVAVVSVVGSNQQACGARFVAEAPTPSPPACARGGLARK
jgi:3-oxoacyl-(acyl-carrier-protein) synthase